MVKFFVSWFGSILNIFLIKRLVCLLNQMLKLSLMVMFGFIYPVNADTNDEISHYKHQIKITNPNQQTLLKFAMPDEVYQKVAHANLTDIAIFDSKGNPQAFQIIATPAEINIVREKVEFFPIYTKSRKLPKLSPEKLQNEHKILIESKQVRKTQIGMNYIIPLKDSMHKNLQELELIWKKTGKNWIAEISLYVSDDLQNWQRISQKCISIANLDYSGKVLMRNTVPIEFTSNQKYLLVHLDGNAPDINLQQVFAITNLSKSTSPVKVIELAPEGKINRSALIYKSDGFYPVNRLNIKFIRSNHLSNVIFYSREKPTKTFWQYRASGFFYSVKKEDKSINNKPIFVARDTNKYWKLEVLDGHLNDKYYPKLLLEWSPDQVVFIPQGKGPYILAFGSTSANGSQNIAQIKKALKKYNNINQLTEAVINN